MATTRSMTDVAFDLMSKKKKSVPFIALWQEVSETMGFDQKLMEKKIAQFYNDMMLDNRFAALEENKWDLRSRRTYEETHFDTSAIIIEDDDMDEDDLDLMDDDDDVDRIKNQDEEDY